MLSHTDLPSAARTCQALSGLRAFALTVLSAGTTLPLSCLSDLSLKCHLHSKASPRPPGLKQPPSLSVLLPHLILFLELTTIQYFPHLFVYCLSVPQWDVSEAVFCFIYHFLPLDSSRVWHSPGSGTQLVPSTCLLNEYMQSFNK